MIVNAVSPASTGAAYEVTCATDAEAAERCQVCHRRSAPGSTFAPNLLERFDTRVDSPRSVWIATNDFRGQVGAMPAGNVEPRIDQLYRDCDD